MLSNLKTIAMLMLVAGLSLGVFAGTLLAGPTEIVSGISRIDTAIDARVQLYTERFELDEAQTARVREILVNYRRDFHQALMGIYQERQAMFNQLHDKATQQILDIVQPDEKDGSGG